MERGLRAHLFVGEPPEPMLAAGRVVYAGAFGRPPYDEGPERADGFVVRVRRYASERDGVRVVIVEDDAGPTGLGLAVLARPGDWWRGRLRTNLGNVATLDDAVAALDPTGRATGKPVIRVRP